MQALLGRAQKELRLCKPWLPSLNYRSLAELFADGQVALGKTAAAFPGQATLIAQRRRVVGPPPPADGVPCSGCSNRSFQLRKCSGCQAVSYCSRECQVRHWKEGGHRRECAQLAAAAGFSTTAATR